MLPPERGTPHSEPSRSCHTYPAKGINTSASVAGKNQEKAHVQSVHHLHSPSACALAQANTMTSGRPSAALNPEQCEAIWNNAVPSGDLLAKSAAAPFIVNFTQVDNDGSGDISKAEFLDACAKGLVKNIEN
jgi:hypothetical protein